MSRGEPSSLDGVPRFFERRGHSGGDRAARRTRAIGPAKLIRVLILAALLFPKLALGACTGGFSPTDVYSTAVCADTPLFYWRMDASSGNEINGGSVGSGGGN